MNFVEVRAFIDSALENEKLNNIQDIVLVESWNGLTYAEIAEKVGYSNDHIRVVGAQLWEILSQVLEEKITKRNCKSELGRLSRKSIKSTTSEPTIPPSLIYPNESVVHTDWEDAPDNSIFLGRETDILQLSSWINQDRCRMIGIFGIGGIGKTAIAVELAQKLQLEFDYVIWRSLRNVPPLDDILTRTIAVVSELKDTENNLPTNLEKRIRHLIQYFKEHRCLLILDNVETILQSGDRCGRFCPGYENYGFFLHNLGEIVHKSCVLLTSREKPQEFSRLEGVQLPVRSWHLTGVQPEIGKTLIELKGQFSATPESWQTLVELYGGNPLALKIVSAAIQDIFNSQIDQFLDNSVFIFDDITELLNEQFYRLSPLEQQVMYWLAIEREPVTIGTLQDDILESISKRELFESLKSLVRRSLIYQTKQGYSQQPVVMEYLIEQLRQKVTHEIISDSPSLLISHALQKTQTKEYIRASQQRILITPITQQLLKYFGTLEDLENKLQDIINLLRQKRFLEAGYGPGNILSLAQELNVDFRGYDFSELPIRQVDLQTTFLRDVNLQGAALHDTLLSNTLDHCMSIAIDSRGEFLATGGSGGTITLWSFPEMKEEAHLLGHSTWAQRMIFSRDSRLLVSVGLDNTARVWAISAYSDTGKLHGDCIAVLEDHSAPVTSVAFSRDEQLLITSGYDQTIKFWNVENWVCIRTIEEATGAVTGIALSPDGDLLVSGSFDGFATLYDLRKNTSRRTVDHHQDSIWSVVFHPDGHCFFTCSYDHTIKIWNTLTGDCIQTLKGHTNKISGLACSRDGQFLVSGSHDRTIRIWSLDKRKCIKVLQGHKSDIWDVILSPDDKLVASVCQDHSIKLWEVDTGQALKTIQSNYSNIWSVAISPDEKTLISGGEDRKLRLWDVPSKTCLKSWTASSNEILTVAFHPEGHLIGSAGADWSIKLWDVHSRKCVHQLNGHQDSIWSIAFSPDGQLIASAGRDSMMYVWDVKTGQCLQALKHDFLVWGASFSYDNKILASGSYDCKIKLWDTQTWEPFKTLIGHEGFINSVCFSPNSTLLASGGYDYTVRTWNAQTGESLLVLRGHQNVIWSVAFNPEGDRIASASFDGTVKVWDSDTGDCLRTLTAHQGFVFSVSFLSDNRIASSSSDGTIKIWGIESGQCLTTLSPPKLYEGLNISGVQGLSDTQRNMLLSLGAIED